MHCFRITIGVKSGSTMLYFFDTFVKNWLQIDERKQLFQRKATTYATKGK